MLSVVNELGVYVLVLQYKYLHCKQASFGSSGCIGGESVQSSRVLFLENGSACMLLEIMFCVIL